MHQVFGGKPVRSDSAITYESSITTNSSFENLVANGSDMTSKYSYSSNAMSKYLYNSYSTAGSGVATDCPFCQRSFNKTSNLKRHILTHTGEKPYACPKCPYRAAQKVQVVQHIRTKHGTALLPNSDHLTENQRSETNMEGSRDSIHPISKRITYSRENSSMSFNTNGYQDILSALEHDKDS